MTRAAASPDPRSGERIRFLRRLSRTSLPTLAAVLDQPTAVLRGIEAGEIRLTSLTRRRLAARFDLAATWFDGDGPAHGFPQLLDLLLRGTLAQGLNDGGALLALLVRFAPTSGTRSGAATLATLRAAWEGGSPMDRAFLLEMAHRFVAGMGRVASAPSAATAPGFSERSHVLLVDAACADAAATRHLRAAGFSVATAGCGQLALGLLASTASIDALVTDYASPGLGGVELLQTAARLRPGVAGLVITGFLGGVPDRDTLPPRAEVLCRPFGGAELVRRLRLLLRPGHEPDRPAAA